MPIADLRSLPQTTHQHHDQIEPHVDRLPELAELIGHVPAEEFASRFEAECAFLVGQLVPHMEAIETTLYGRLEDLMGTRHSMTPMRREHQQLEALFASLCAFRKEAAGGTLDQAGEIGLRRVLYRLYAILKVHLAEEELYLGVLDRNLSAAEKDALARGIDHAVAEPL
ncbi:MAG: hemerythrin domain-containing protein [Candidatus Limnocylindrales bacterium]